MNVLFELLKRKTGLIVIIVLGLLYGGALFAPFIAPYPYDEDDVLYSYSPPSRIHFFDPETNYFGPFVYKQNYEVNEYYKRVYYEDKSQIYPLKFFVKGFKYKILGFWESDRHLFGVEGAKVFLLGADLRGRDLFSRILYGGRVSLSIVIVAALISFFLGLIVGGISGYFGGKVDTVLMRLCELLMMFPVFYLMLILRASFLSYNLTSAQIYFLVVVILAFIGWAGLARVIRGMSMSLRENDYVYAAKASGVSNFKIITRHILPHTFSYSVVALVLGIPGYILAEAGLSLIGLGIQEPQASWGNLLSSAMGIVNIRLYPWILTPGIFIVVTGMCFYLLGDMLRDILDPKHKVL
jgi:peptide/nickel transport system permease protein